MNLKRRLPQYVIGLLLMSLGIVFIKKADIGISPISAIPAAVSNLTIFSLGNMTIAFHVLCVAAIIAVTGKVTVKTLLILPLAVAFGYLIDLFMLLKLSALSLWMKTALCFAGILLTAAGIVVVNGADLMLPAPDALMQAISEKTGKPLSIVKTIGDVTWVVITVVIELIAAGRIISVGVGTLASMLLTGKFIGVFTKLFPFLKWEPINTKQTAKQSV